MTRRTSRRSSNRPLAMSIVNQLYWRDPATYKALVDASEKLRVRTSRCAERQESRHARAGRTASHDAGEGPASRPQRTRRNTDAPLTDAVRDAVRRTLAALPTDERPGRLTREPPPAGFSLLTGVKPRPAGAKQSTRAQRRSDDLHGSDSAEELRLMKLEQARLKEAEAQAPEGRRESAERTGKARARN